MAHMGTGDIVTPILMMFVLGFVAVVVMLTFNLFGSRELL